MTAARHHGSGQIPEAKAAIVGANIRTLRQRNGWTQRQFGELMGWPNASTVCAAEGHRSGRQRGFTTREILQLAAIFGVSFRQLTAQCANCGGHPPTGFACLACGATPDGEVSVQAVGESSVVAAGALGADGGDRGNRVSGPGIGEGDPLEDPESLPIYYHSLTSSHGGM